MTHHTGSVPDTERADDWRDAGLCGAKDHSGRPLFDPETWFPTGTTGPWELVIGDAKAVCNRCPVIELCARWALENKIAFGIWGGLDERARASYWRRRGFRLMTADPDREPGKASEATA